MALAYFQSFLQNQSTLSSLLERLTFKDPSLINLFKLYLRPILEYNVSAWMPYQVGDIRKYRICSDNIYGIGMQET